MRDDLYPWDQLQAKTLLVTLRLVWRMQRQLPASGEGCSDKVLIGTHQIVWLKKIARVTLPGEARALCVKLRCSTRQLSNQGSYSLSMRQR